MREVAFVTLPSNLNLLDNGKILPGLLPARPSAVLSRDIPDLLPDCLHVWRVPLDQDRQCISSFVQTLAADETARMQRYRFDRDRNRFAVARGALRYLLSAYLGIPPRAIVFSYGANGKPCVKNSRNDFSLHFNISHSHTVALMAFVLDMEIGVDIEKIRPASDIESVAAVFLSAQEKNVFEKLSIEEKSDAFYRYWTFKEAYMKACGQGMTLDPRSFAVSIEDDMPGLARLPGGDENCDGWRFARLDVGAEYEAAVVYACGNAQSISMRDF